MDYSAAKFWFDATQTAFMAFVSIYVWWSNRTRATKTAIDRVDARVTTHETRILLIEQSAQHTPNHEDIGAIHNRVDQVGQGVKQIEGQMTQINHTLHLIQQHLLENGK